MIPKTGIDTSLQAQKSTAVDKCIRPEAVRQAEQAIKLKTG
jgi:hypothetical protein